MEQKEYEDVKIPVKSDFLRLRIAGLDHQFLLFSLSVEVPNILDNPVHDEISGGALTQLFAFVLSKETYCRYLNGNIEIIQFEKVLLKEDRVVELDVLVHDANLFQLDDG